MRLFWLCLCISTVYCTEYDYLLPYLDAEWRDEGRATTRRSLATADDPGDYELFPAANYRENLDTTSTGYAYIRHQRLMEVIDGRFLSGPFGRPAPFHHGPAVATAHLCSSTAHVWYLDNPMHHFAIKEPAGGGCGERARAFVTETSSLGPGDPVTCRVATNAGFFNVTDDSCLGNVVAGGKLVQLATRQNGPTLPTRATSLCLTPLPTANFGILRNGTFVVGYIPRGFVETGEFQQLVGGVVWLVRNGRNFVTESSKLEDGSSQTTSSLRGFIEVVSARTAIGHDKAGRVVVVNVDGKTGSGRGIHLHQLADLLVSLGVENAVNLDGGGSVNVAENGTVVNYPSDPCPGEANRFSCQRAVSTIVCFHDAVATERPKSAAPVRRPTLAPKLSLEDVTTSNTTMLFIIMAFALVMCATYWFIRRKARAKVPPPPAHPTYHI